MYVCDNGPGLTGSNGPFKLQETLLYGSNGGMRDLVTDMYKIEKVKTHHMHRYDTS